MDWAVPSSDKGPILVHTSFEERLTVIAVDPRVKTFDDAEFDVLFVGTSAGRVLKIFNLLQDFGKNT